MVSFAFVQHCVKNDLVEGGWKVVVAEWGNRWMSPFQRLISSLMLGHRGMARLERILG